MGAARRGGKSAARKVLGAVVPIASMIVTYYLTQATMGSALAYSFSDLPPQTIPMVISMAVGAITRQLIK